MSAGTYDATCEQGATWDLEVTWLDEDSVAIPTVDCTARLQARSQPGLVLLLDLDTDVDGGIALSDDGVFSITARPSQTASLPPNPPQVARYDLKVYFPDGAEYRVIEGKFVVDPAQTLDEG